MENFKKAKVVMLPTKEKSHIHKELEGNLIFFEIVVEKRNFTNTYHLYITSEDNINENDWCLLDHNIGISIGYSVLQCLDVDAKNGKYTFKDKEGGLFTTGRCSKIVVTTDKSLTTDCKLNKNKFYYLPQPSQQFIEHYIENYNKREIIKNVLVEYEEDKFNYKGSIGNTQRTFNLKINPKDNTITIKKLKDNWNREEVIKFGNKVREYCKNGWQQDSLHKVFFEWDKYINENL